MKKLFIGITAILLVAMALYLYLLRDNTIPVPDTGSENLNELILGAPVNRINLTENIPDTLFIPGKQVITPQIESDEVLEPFSSTQALQFGDFLILMEFLTNNVVVYTLDGDYVQKLAGDELSRAASITSHSDSLYIYDYGNKEVHVYGSRLIFHRSFPFDTPYYSQGSVKMSGGYIAYQNEEASGFRMTDSGVNYLLSIAPLDQPDSTIANLIPRIVPPGKHPGGFNNLLFSMNERRDIVSSYPALPYLFVYRSFEQFRNIQLISPAFEEVDNPALTPFQPVMGEAVSINALIDDLHLMNNGDILLFSFGQLHHIQLQQNGGYMHNQSFVMLRDDTGEAIQSVSSISGSQNDPKTFYIVSSGILIEIELP